MKKALCILLAVIIACAASVAAFADMMAIPDPLDLFHKLVDYDYKEGEAVVSNKEGAKDLKDSSRTLPYGTAVTVKSYEIENLKVVVTVSDAEGYYYKVPVEDLTGPGVENLTVAWIIFDEIAHYIKVGFILMEVGLTALVTLPIDFITNPLLLF